MSWSNLAPEPWGPNSYLTCLFIQHSSKAYSLKFNIVLIAITRDEIIGPGTYFDLTCSPKAPTCTRMMHVFASSCCAWLAFYGLFWTPSCSLWWCWEPPRLNILVVVAILDTGTCRAIQCCWSIGCSWESLLMKNFDVKHSMQRALFVKITVNSYQYSKQYDYRILVQPRRVLPAAVR